MKNKRLEIVTCRLAGGGHGPECPPARSRPGLIFINIQWLQHFLVNQMFLKANTLILCRNDSNVSSVILHN